MSPIKLFACAAFFIALAALTPANPQAPAQQKTAALAVPAGRVIGLGELARLTPVKPSQSEEIGAPAAMPLTTGDGQQADVWPGDRGCGGQDPDCLH
jgi:hypothetical protein